MYHTTPTPDLNKYIDLLSRQSEMLRSDDFAVPAALCPHPGLSGVKQNSFSLSLSLPLGPNQGLGVSVGFGFGFGPGFFLSSGVFFSTRSGCFLCHGFSGVYFLFHCPRIGFTPVVSMNSLEHIYSGRTDDPPGYLHHSCGVRDGLSLDEGGSGFNFAA